MRRPNEDPCHDERVRHFIASRSCGRKSAFSCRIAFFGPVLLHQGLCEPLIEEGGGGGGSALMLIGKSGEGGFALHGQRCPNQQEMPAFGSAFLHHGRSEGGVDGVIGCLLLK